MDVVPVGYVYDFMHGETRLDILFWIAQLIYVSNLLDKVHFFRVLFVFFGKECDLAEIKDLSHIISCHL